MVKRIFRDIPDNICGGARQYAENLKKMLRRPCKCIRCREVKDNVVDPKNIHFVQL